MIGERIKTARNRTGLTQEELSERIKKARQTVVRWEKGERAPQGDDLKLIANALETTVSYLTGETDDPSPLKKTEPSSSKEPSLKVDNVPHDGWIEVPVLARENAVCAGDGWDHDFIFPEVERYELMTQKTVGEISRYPQKRPYIVPVEGDSMEAANIPDGCEVVINPEERVKSGETALVRYRDGDEDKIAVKWIYWQRDGGVEIRSATTKYPSYVYTKEEIREGLFFCCGKVMKTLGNPKNGA